MTEPTPDPPKRRRRWFTISLRTLMVLILVVGGLMGWKARKASLQRRAVARIEWLRGTVQYDWQYKYDKLISPPANGPSAPLWLRKTLGDGYFQDVTKVTLHDVMKLELLSPLDPDLPHDSPEWRAIEAKNREIDEKEIALKDDQLRSLDGLDRLESLELFSAPLDSDGLARLGRMTSLRQFFSSEPFDAGGLSQLARLTNLEDLRIDLTRETESSLAFLDSMPRLRVLLITTKKITDAGLARLGRIANLEYLFIEKSGITDASLAHLEGLDKLKCLSLGSTSGITDAGLAHLKSLKSLDHLEVKSASGVTDAGLAHLAGLTKLDWLELGSASNITDAGMVSVAGLPELRLLSLRSTPLTDAGLARLRGLTKLRIISLSGEKIGDPALNELKTAIPGLEVQLNRDRLTPNDGRTDLPGPSELNPFHR